MKKRTWIIAGIIILVLLINVPLVSLLLLNSEWLKQTLAEKASDSLNADLTIEALSFEVFKGKASLSGVTFSRYEEASDLDMALQSAEMEVELLPLLYHSIQIRRLELTGPQITSVVRRLPKKKKPPSEPPPEEKKPPKKKTEFTIAELLIRDGVIDFTAIREGREPFKARATDIRYSAKNVTPHSLPKLLYGSDLHCKIEMGTTAILDKSGMSTPATFSLKGIDLPYASKYLESGQFDEESSESKKTEQPGLWAKVKTRVDTFLDESSDPLIVTDGTMDAFYTLEEKEAMGHVKVKLKGLKLAANPEMSEQKFAFIPVETIIGYVEEKEGNITLEYDIDKEVSISDDLDFIVNEFWKGFWIAILKEISPESVDALIEKGAEKAIEFLQTEEGKQKILDLFRQKEDKEETMNVIPDLQDTDLSGNLITNGKFHKLKAWEQIHSSNVTELS